MDAAIYNFSKLECLAEFRADCSFLLPLFTSLYIHTRKLHIAFAYMLSSFAYSVRFYFYFYSFLANKWQSLLHGVFSHFIRTSYLLGCFAH